MTETIEKYFIGDSVIPLIISLCAVSAVIAYIIYITVRKRHPKAKFSVVDAMEGKEFEQFCAAGFRHLGYKTDTTPATGDYGIDILLKKKGTTVAVQTKRYNGTVGVKAVQQAASGKAMYNADKAMVVTNSTYTKAAETLAEANGVILWSRKDMARAFRISE